MQEKYDTEVKIAEEDFLPRRTLSHVLFMQRRRQAAVFKEIDAGRAASDLQSRGSRGTEHSQPAPCAVSQCGLCGSRRAT